MNAIEVREIVLSLVASESAFRGSADAEADVAVAATGDDKREVARD